MKKLFYFAAAAVALAACAKNEVIPVNSGENQEITFNVAPKTKADPQTFNTNNVFASWAYYLPKGKTWNADWKEAVEYIGTEFVGSTISFKDDVWKDQTTSYYWPKEGSLTFFAYSINSPELAGSSVERGFYCEKEAGNAEGSTKDQYGITGSLNLDAHPNTDFLVADVAYDKSANERVYNFDGVPTLFKHRLSRVQFAVKKKADYANTTITLNSITFDHLSCGMSYVQFIKDGEGFSESITPSTDYKPQEYTKTNFVVASCEFDNIPVANEVRYIYIPQNFKDENTTATIKVTYTVTYKTGISETYTRTINVKDIFDSWEMGKKYTFKLIFSLNEITWAPAVQDWEDVTNATGKEIA